ncbi:hypothetical protein Godav_024705 [Gossypium davidsonii]|uniref:Uncharacterized protein n=1 Tax=Gossypium davidsonii TaxID=34287 RepID=A0A7J8TI59_GOSDV|nr:hypothetical protein [Gossypium davidsonii]
MTYSVEKTIATLVRMSIGSLLLLKMRFPYYDQLTIIYDKDRATGKYAQITTILLKK